MSAILPFLLTFLALSQAQPYSDDPPPPSSTVCIVGAGIGGSSVAHFLRKYSPDSSRATKIRVFERNGVVGGRIATVTVAGETFEAGASILHPKNLHAVDYTKILNLKVKEPGSDSLSLGIWNGNDFVFKTIKLSCNVPLIDKLLKLPITNTLVSLVNSALMFVRYGFSLLKMQNFVENTVEKFLKYYEGHDSRPVFETVDEMLQWAGLYNLTTRTLQDELVDAGLSTSLINELVTVITRVNYGQSVYMSGLAGAVSLAGSGAGLWSIEGGNWQMAAGLINQSVVALHLHEEIRSVADLGDYYELNSTKGKSYKCEVAVVATPLDELDIQFFPPISIPERKLQHTHTTFVRGLLNPAYFGLKAVTKIPDLVGTIEDPNIPFSSISVLKKHNEKESSYKIFSRQPMADTLLDSIFSVRKETIRINWAAYPHYHAPEVFAPFILDRRHLYYVNAFENAASTMETSAVAAENIARLILSRYFGKVIVHSSNMSASSQGEGTHLDL
ncbi:farnesylcysteine lyase [Cajanus cajan]|uniref:Prenylcysteine oxidase n=1 Tax=Cajanus cajan TaxID=3821 RepID=A0A151RY30_CAJCA|nr:farnesylcysteine lyase [Cajanus cajan]KYP47462.1 putative prenylcysteine oxidase [Cajanus cajan]